MKEKLEAFGRLLTIMDELREKCPWDREQTMESLRHLTIEETYELTDAITKKDMDEVRKELGDLMLHVVFYSKIASETKTFDIADVLNSLCDKLIFRHPHIYGDVKAEDAGQVKQNWEKIKQKEGNRTVLSGVPSGLPALIKAMRIQEKARAVGFDWDEPHQVWDKVQEELNEFQEETQKPDNKEKMEQELGDVLFSLINYARFLDINPEDALEHTNRKFITRFNYMEQKLKEQGKAIGDSTLSEMDVYWNEAKTLKP